MRFRVGVRGSVSVGRLGSARSRMSVLVMVGGKGGERGYHAFFLAVLVSLGLMQTASPRSRGCPRAEVAFISSGVGVERQAFGVLGAFALASDFGVARTMSP